MKATVAALASLALAVATLAGQPWQERATDRWPSSARALSAVPAPQDTSRPAVPTELNLPQDTTITVHRPGDTRFLYFRNVVGVAFDDTTGGATVRAVLRKYSAVIIGGEPDVGAFGAYIVQVPDPGPTFGAVDSLVTRIAAESGVDYAYMVTSREARGIR